MFKLPKIGRHLHDKVLFILLLVGIIPLVILGVLSLYNLDLFHKADVASIENNLINQKAEEIEGFMSNIRETLALKVDLPYVGEIQTSTQEFLLKQILAELENLEEISFINLNGRETARFSRVFPDGAAEDELQDQSRIDKFVKAKAGQRYLGPVYFTLKGPMVTISSPVVNKNDIVIMVLTGEVNLGSLNGIVRRSRLGDAGYVYMTDQDGFLIAHSQPDKNIPTDLKPVGYVSAVLEGIKSQTNNRYTSLWNESVVAEGKLLRDLGLTVIAEWPTRDADKVVITVRDQITVVSLLVLSATLLLSVLFTNRIVRPIKTLEKGTQLVAEGKFDQPINIKTGDEIEELGAAFNNMTAGLRRLQELKNEFVFIAAHELKTPLTAIKGFLTLLVDESGSVLNENSKDYVDKAMGASNRLAGLVNDILEIARSEAGRIKVDISPQNIQESIRTILAEVKTIADQKRITINYKELAGLPMVLADSAKLKEVITNFLSNAVKYNNEGGWVKVYHEDLGAELATHVEDNGFGISEDEQKHLFEKFFRADIGRTKSIEGTGLGLFITRELVQKMGGRVWFKSVPGRGTTFSFALKKA